MQVTGKHKIHNIGYPRFKGGRYEIWWHTEDLKDNGGLFTFKFTWTLLTWKKLRNRDTVHFIGTHSTLLYLLLKSLIYTIYFPSDG